MPDGYGYPIKKLVRETAMSLLNLPYLVAEDLGEEIETRLNEAGCTWVATDTRQFDLALEKEVAGGHRPFC